VSSRPAHWPAVVLLAFGSYVMLADFVNLRQAEGMARPASPDGLALPQPWGGYGWRSLARLAGDTAVLSPDTAREALLEAAVRYPLDALQWLDLARIEARASNTDRVDEMLLRANAVQPFQRSSLWSAAQVALQTGNAEMAERQLRRWLRLFPRDTGQALFIGKRWIDEPGELLDRMLPPGRDFLAEAMQTARHQRDLKLAEAVWARLEPKPHLDDSVFLEFTELLMETGDTRRVQELWTAHDPTYRPGGIANGSFSRPLGEPLGINWRTNRLPAGVRVVRDEDAALSPPASLRVEFNGRENISLGAPWLRIPVTPGRRYRLSGSWRARGLTTRSLPYLELSAENGSLRENHPVPSSKFDWTQWTLEFEVPDASNVIRLHLRRNRTDAFDRNIGGVLWLDDVVLEPAGPGAQAPDPFRARPDDEEPEPLLRNPDPRHPEHG